MNRRVKLEKPIWMNKEHWESWQKPEWFEDTWSTWRESRSRRTLVNTWPSKDTFAEQILWAGEDQLEQARQQLDLFVQTKGHELIERALWYSVSQYYLFGDTRLREYISFSRHLSVKSNKQLRAGTHPILPKERPMKTDLTPEERYHIIELCDYKALVTDKKGEKHIALYSGLQSRVWSESTWSWKRHTHRSPQHAELAISSFVSECTIIQEEYRNAD